MEKGLAKTKRLLSRNNVIYNLFILATAVLIISICSKSSPLYPFNDGLDANCYVTVGKSVWSGILPYRDLFDHKGPVLYLLHSIATLFWRESFFGVYILEILACTWFLCICRKILEIYCSRPFSLWIPVIAACVYSAQCFVNGDSAEELCLPIIAYGVYVGLKAIHSGENPTRKELFFVGVTSACILWIKFSMLGFYLGWFVAFLILQIHKRDFLYLIKMLGYIVLGVAVVSAPVLIFFAFNNALSDMFNVYFYDNIFVYAGLSSGSSKLAGLITNYLHSAAGMLRYNLFTSVSVAIAIVSLIVKRRKSELLFVISTLVFTFLTVHAGVYYKYYSLIFSAFIPLGIPPVEGFIRKRLCKFSTKKNVRICVRTVVPILCLIFAYFMSDNTYLMKYKKADMPQYKFAETISKNEDATLLNYNMMDGGFYTVSGIIPNCKYFYKSNLNVDEMMETQKKFISNGEVDFVVTDDEGFKSVNYKCVDTYSFLFHGKLKKYYLHQLNR